MRVSIRAFLAIFFCAVMTGCATVKTDQLTAKEAGNMSEKTVVMSRYSKKPDFVAQTATNVQFGLLGWFAAKSHGNAMIEDNHIADPAIAISKQLADELKKDYSLSVVERDDLKVESGDLEKLANVYQGYDYILDVHSLGWNSIYFTSDWNSYKVYYTAQARLINAASREVVAQEVCNYIPEYENTNNAPSYEELKNGEGLRRELKKSVDYCVGEISKMAKLHKKKNSPDVAVIK